MELSPSVENLFAAFSKAQAEIGCARADGFNKHLGATYASMDSLIEAYKEPCSKHGLAVIQSVFNEGVDYYVETLIAHSSGQWMKSKMKVLLQKNDMQSLGAAVTYAKRYSIASAFGIPIEVDEGDVQKSAERAQVAQQTRQAAAKVGQETREKIKEKPIMNHATGKPFEAAVNASTNPTTGHVKPSELARHVAAAGGIEALANQPSDDWIHWQTKIEFGKFTGKTIKEVGFKVVCDYMDWMENEAIKKNQTLNPGAKKLQQILQGSKATI